MLTLKGSKLPDMKEIELLQAQIDKLNNKDFDLDAWKQYTVVLLSRIFGEHNPKIRQVEKIEYDFSSWSLRDTSGKSAYMETCKKLGREVLQASIDELNAFGLPEKERGEDMVPLEVITRALEEELKVSQFRKIKELVTSDLDPEIKKKELLEMIKGFDAGFSDHFVLNILTHPDLARALKS